MSVNFDNSSYEGRDTKLIAKIANRYHAVVKDHFPKLDRISVMMDITACHRNGNPLKLEQLAEAELIDLVHDVQGILVHIDRNTGELKDYFSPRYSY